MPEDPGRQRYCGNCGTEVRPGMSFCVSCGAPVTAGSAEPGPTPSEEPSPFDNLLTWFRQATGHLKGILSSVSTDGARRLPRRSMEWFRHLPGLPKLVLVGLAVLVLLVLLSPVSAIVVALLLGVSIIALIIRVAQKGSLKNWGMVAVISMVLMLTFVGISNALYGTGLLGLSSPDSGGGSVGGANSGGKELENSNPPQVEAAPQEDDSVDALSAAFTYYDMASNGDYVGTYWNLSEYSRSFYTPVEWIDANMTLRTIEVQYTVTEANMISDGVAEVHLIMDFPDGTSQERLMRFVLENGTWVHDLTNEEYALFDSALNSPIQ